MNSVASSNRLRVQLAVIVFIHFVVVLWHGASHVYIPVPLTQQQSLFVTVVIVILPLLGASALWSRYSSIATWLIALSMLASLLFGFVYHFVLHSADYVIEVPSHSWRHSFVLSAALLTVTETIGTVLGFVAARQK